MEGNGGAVAQRRHRALPKGVRMSHSEDIAFFFWNRYTKGFEKKKLWYWMKEAHRMVEWEMCAVHGQEDREV
jgi:hypothetical protein